MVADHLSMIRENAFRLYEDAILLFSNNRYASSIALSILAIEEVGKYLLLCGDRNDLIPAQLSHHSSKQSAISKNYLTDLWMSFSRRIAVDHRELWLRRLEELRSVDLQSSLENSPSTKAFEQIRETFEEIVSQELANEMMARYVVATGLIQAR